MVGSKWYRVCSWLWECPVTFYTDVAEHGFTGCPSQHTVEKFTSWEVREQRKERSALCWLSPFTPSRLLGHEKLPSKFRTYPTPTSTDLFWKYSHRLMGKPVVLLTPGYEMCYERSSGIFVLLVLGVQVWPSACQSSVLLPSDNHNSPVIPKRKVTFTLRHFSTFPIFLWFGFTLLSTS